MDSITNNRTMAAQIPSRVRMPICGRPDASTRARDAFAGMGHVGLDLAYVPGNPAWSPPIC